MTIFKINDYIIVRTYIYIKSNKLGYASSDVTKENIGFRNYPTSTIATVCSYLICIFLKSK